MIENPAAALKLSAHNLTVARGPREAVRDLSLDITGGELVAVVGANGAGKSTLLKSLAGLLTPKSGSVTLNGNMLASYERRTLAKEIAFLPQDRTVHWALAAERVVALGRLPHRSFAAGESTADRLAVVNAMTRMEVMQFDQRPIATLSGGEQARVLIARALAQEARIVIADEPTAGLDPAHTLQVFDEFRRISREGRAVVTALHDLSLAARYATRVVVLHHGACIANGPPARVLSTEILKLAFNIEAVITQVAGIPVVVPSAPLT